jgi:hypothetical protein
MNQIIQFLDGKKTYISGVTGMMIGVAFLMQWITPEQFNALAMVAASFGLIGVRDAMRKFEK